ncbi:MAG: flippase-like domain-containing protein [Bacteroidetes bacterium]|nr:flippase-like domain-containing protein [Bacteroidota bacterium]
MKRFFVHPIVLTALKIVVSIGLLGGLLLYIDVDAVTASFAAANGWYLAAGAGMAAVQLLIHLYRWRYLIRLVDAEISNADVFRSFFVGFMAGFFTPAQVGEFAGRIASHPTVNRSHVIGITLIDKLYWAALTFVIGGTGLAVFAAEQYASSWHFTYRYLITFVLGFIIAVFLSPERVKVVLTLLPERIRQHRFYEMILVIEERFRNRNAWLLFTVTAALYGAILLEYYFLFNAFGPVALGDAMMCAAAVFFVKAVILPVSFGDLGVRESAAVYFLTAVGSSAAVAFNASIVMSFLNVILPTGIGALLVITLRRR